MEIKVVSKNFKIKKKFKNDNSKIYLGISLELLRAVWGQFSFRQFLVPAYISSQDLQAPSNVVSANYRVLICCTSCHFQSSSLVFVYFCFLSLQVSSVSIFRPDTRVGRWSFIQAHLFSCVSGGRNTANKYHCHVWGVLAVYGPHWVCPRSQRVCFPSLHCSGFKCLCRGTV